MTVRKLVFVCAALCITLNWSLHPCFAQRGGRGGGGGGSHPSGGSAASSAAHINSSAGQNNGSISAHVDGNSNRSFDGGSSRSISRDSDGNHESHESFYRGPSDRFDNDGGNRDGVREGNHALSSITRNSNDRGRNNNWSQFSNNVRNDWSRRDGRNLPFLYGWWGGHGDRWPAFSPFAYSRYRDRPYYWWGWTPAGRLVDWLAFGWNRPRYWGYGYDGNIYCQDDYVYYDGDRYLPVSDYYQQVYDLAHSVPNISENEGEKMDWSPLGVFAVARDDRQGEDQDRTIQLAINKDGVISGTYYNNKNDKAHPLTGMVDEHTQRAAWAFADGTQQKAVFETSVFNLTKPESTMMVLYGPSERDTEVWHLVRLERPESSQQASTSGDDQRQQGDNRNDLP
jgi:hypothetical protein